ncbi:hypothetical protein, partial [Granulicella sp. L56]|uniref:hypothetical protein n=1 Tax=Granulicella sp. L56 TaxID=1747222 RepID=UPI001C203BD0
MRRTYEKSSIKRRRPPTRSEAEVEAIVDQRVEEKVRGLEQRIREEMMANFAMLQQTMGKQAMG